MNPDPADPHAVSTENPYSQDQQMLMLHEIPTTSAMTREQRTGLVCVWCSTSSTTAGPLIDLGGVGEWRPHACAPCRTARIECLRTYSAWLTHVDACPACPVARCSAAEPLALAHHAARRAAGKEDQVWCVACSQRVHLAHRRIIPLLWYGDTAIHRFYVHSGPCPTTGRKGVGALRAV